MTTPAELRQLAGRLTAQATTLPSVLDAVAAHTGPDVWRGPASDRFAHELQEQRRRLRAVADELLLAARTCTVNADAFEAASAAASQPVPARLPPRFS